MRVPSLPASDGASGRSVEPSPMDRRYANRSFLTAHRRMADSAAVIDCRPSAPGLIRECADNAARTAPPSEWSSLSARVSPGSLGNPSSDAIRAWHLRAGRLRRTVGRAAAAAIPCAPPIGIPGHPSASRSSYTPSIFSPTGQFSIFGVSRKSERKRSAPAARVAAIESAHSAPGLSACAAPCRSRVRVPRSQWSLLHCAHSRKRRRRSHLALGHVGWLELTLGQCACAGRLSPSDRVPRPSPLLPRTPVVCPWWRRWRPSAVSASRPCSCCRPWRSSSRPRRTTRIRWARCLPPLASASLAGSRSVRSTSSRRRACPT